MKVAVGKFKRTSTVFSSMAVKFPWSATVLKYPVRARRASGSVIRSSVNTMSSAVTGPRPLLHSASCRRKVYTSPASFTSQVLARSPMISVVLTGLYSTSPLNRGLEGVSTVFRLPP